MATFIDKAFVCADIVDVEWHSPMHVVPQSGYHKDVPMIPGALYLTTRQEFDYCLARLRVLLAEKDDIISFINNNQSLMVPYKTVYYPMGDGSELDLQEGACFYIGFNKISNYVKNKIFVDWRPGESYDPSYPIGGETEYDSEGRFNALWLNDKRWEFCEFLVKKLTELRELLK